MLCVLSICHKEAQTALKLAQWIRELGGVGNHECLLSVNRTMASAKLHEPIMDELKAAFRVVTFYIQSPEDERPGPPQMPHVYSANNAFIRVNKDVIDDHSDTPYFWLEGDAIPLVSDWLDRIQTEYFAAGKPFMGARVIYPNTPEHMSGVAVYRAIGRNAPDYVMAQNNAWDVVAASQILPKAHFTGLIQHDWKAAPFNSQEDIARIRSGVVVYHQCKDGSLIDRLRESRGGVATTRSVHHGEIAGLNPAPATSPDVAALLAEVAALRSQLEVKEKVKARMAKARAGRKQKVKA